MEKVENQKLDKGHDNKNRYIKFGGWEGSFWLCKGQRVGADASATSTSEKERGVSVVGVNR